MNTDVRSQGPRGVVCRVGRDRGEGGVKARRCWGYLGREQATLSPASRCRWEIRRGIGGKQDSTARIPMGVAQKQFVVHLWTLCQKVVSRAIDPVLGVKRSAPYSKIGPTKEAASRWHRYRARPAPGGLRRLIRAKAPWARASLCEKLADESRAGVSQYPSHRSESRGRNSSPLI